MKLVDARNCLFCSDSVLDAPSHRLYQCLNSRDIWNMVNNYLMEFRDWMTANGNTQYSIDHNLYIAEKEVFFNFYEENPNSVICLTVLIVKYYIHMLTSIDVKPFTPDIPIKIHSTFTLIINSNKLSTNSTKKGEFFEEFLSIKSNEYYLGLAGN